MIASKIIKKLQELIDKHGDCEVWGYPFEGFKENIIYDLDKINRIKVIEKYNFMTRYAEDAYYFVIEPNPMIHDDNKEDIND